MTFLEKVKKDKLVYIRYSEKYPNECVQDIFVTNEKCPKLQHGYFTCAECWDREIPDVNKSIVTKKSFLKR